MKNQILAFLLLAIFAVGCTTKIDDKGRYAICTNYTTSEVEDFAKLVKSDMLHGNWDSLVAKVVFPVMINGIPMEKDGFVDVICDTVVTHDFIKAIRKETCHNMFCNYQGIMLANGCIWISEISDQNGNSRGLKVISFNSFK